jgi:hypothetical protein
MEILIRHYLQVEPDQDWDRLVEQHAEALWLEERQQEMMKIAVNKGFAGGS